MKLISPFTLLLVLLFMWTLQFCDATGDSQNASSVEKTEQTDSPSTKSSGDDDDGLTINRSPVAPDTILIIEDLVVMVADPDSEPGFATCNCSDANSFGSGSEGISLDETIVTYIDWDLGLAAGERQVFLFRFDAGAAGHQDFKMAFTGGEHCYVLLDSCPGGAGTLALVEPDTPTPPEHGKKLEITIGALKAVIQSISDGGDKKLQVSSLNCGSECHLYYMRCSEASGADCQRIVAANTYRQ